MFAISDKDYIVAKRHQEESVMKEQEAVVKSQLATETIEKKLK